MHALPASHPSTSKAQPLKIVVFEGINFLKAFFRKRQQLWILGVIRRFDTQDFSATFGSRRCTYWFDASLALKFIPVPSNNTL